MTRQQYTPLKDRLKMEREDFWFNLLMNITVGLILTIVVIAIVQTFG